MFLNPETNKGCHVEMLYVRMVPAPPVLPSLRRLDSNQCGVSWKEGVEPPNGAVSGWMFSSSFWVLEGRVLD